MFYAIIQCLRCKSNGRVSSPHPRRLTRASDKTVGHGQRLVTAEHDEIYSICHAVTANVDRLAVHLSRHALHRSDVDNTVAEIDWNAECVQFNVKRYLQRCCLQKHAGSRSDVFTISRKPILESAPTYFQASLGLGLEPS